jgi:hypothetical protein
MGYTEETLFTLEAIHYWRQYKPKEFIRSIVHEAKGELEVIDAHIKLLRQDSQISRLIIHDLGGDTNVEQFCNILLRRKEKLKTLFDIAWEYTKEI